MSVPISVLILTRDEERNLPGCLDSVSWCDDVVVLDSGSTDLTTALATARGCRVLHRSFDNWSSHQNWAVRNIAFRNPWVLNLDADERIDREFLLEMAAAVGSGEPVAFRMRRRDYFRDLWLKHATFYPTWLIRLYRPEAVEFQRLVNPVTVVDGAVGTLRGHIEHFPFSKGVSHWLERHNSYSSFESQEYLKKPPFSLRDLLTGTGPERRKAAKALFARLPGRPLVKFLYLYVFHRGFLDGAAGLDYCLLLSFYEFMITLKLKEHRLKMAACKGADTCIGADKGAAEA